MSLPAVHEEETSYLYLYPREGRCDELRSLLTGGASVDAVNGHGLTPLHPASRRGHRGEVGLLLRKGVDKD